MDEISKIKEELKFLKFNTEEEFNTTQQRFKETLEFIKSDVEKTEALIQMSAIIKEFMENVGRALDRKDAEITEIFSRLDKLESLINNAN